MAPQEPEPRLSLSMCWYRLDLGSGRSGLVQAHADPGEGHPFGPGGERPAGSSPDRIWKDGRLRCTCHPAHPGLQTGEEKTYFGSLCVAMQSKTSLPCCNFLERFYPLYSLKYHFLYRISLLLLVSYTESLHCLLNQS